MSNEFNPNFKTNVADFCKEEQNKRAAKDYTGNLCEDLRDSERDDIVWESEQLAKSSGIYMEFDRAKTGREKDWSYMFRITIPGGGPVSAKQWQVVDELAEKYTLSSEGKPSIRLTTRQNIQFHWVKKENLVKIIKELAESNLMTLNGCGDNVRNVMACPLSQFSEHYNAVELAHQAGSYFELPREPFIKVFEIDPTFIRTEETDKAEANKFKYGQQLLNRKFKIAFSATILDDNGILIPDNCVELRTNDMGIAPIIENNQVTAFQVYVGGGQGEKNGKPTMATLSTPLCIATRDNLMKILDAVVAVHQEWGDRQNRHWARLKYVIKKQGIQWYQQQVSEKIGEKIELPNVDLDIGKRYLHHGWNKQENSDLFTYGMFVENGRLANETPNGNLKSGVRALVDKYQSDLMITANQDLMFLNLKEEQKEEFENDLKEFGHGKRNGKVFSTLRTLSGACVGRDTCRLTYTESEKYEPVLIDELEELGWGEMQESIGITGCERQCFRPATKSIGLVGSGLDRYMLKLMGTEDGKHQGRPLISEDKTEVYLRSIPRDNVPTVIDTLFKFYEANKEADEDFGYFNNRIGMQSIIEHLKENPATAELMEKPHKVKALLE